MGKRIVGILFTYLIVATIIFFLFRSVGSPIGLHIGENVSPEELAAIEAAFGLNKPWYVQYGEFLTDLFVLEWGRASTTASPPPRWSFRGSSTACS